MDLIKRVLISLVFIMILPSVLIADVLDDELPKDTPREIKERARQTIQLGVENQGVVKMTQTMLQNRFSEQQMIRAYEILDETKRNGLPEEPIMDKLYEGIGKHVQDKNIIAAMEKVMKRYQKASQYAGQINSEKEQSRILTGQIAECLSAGMTDNDIGRIGNSLRKLKTQDSEKSSLEIQTMKTVKTMARTGARSSSVVAAVQEALQNGYTQGKMSQLENAFLNQVRARYNPTDIATTFSRGISKGVSIDEMSRPSYMNMNAVNGMGGNGFRNSYGPGAGIGQSGIGGSAGGAGSGGAGGAGGSGGSGGMGGAGGSGNGSGGGGRR